MAILWGGAGADTLTGGAEENTIGGGAGNDRLTGNSARDQIFGGDGDDTITGGAGDDYLEGGAGRDSFVLRPGDGWDYIGDFQAGAGGDRLDLTAWTGITDVNALLALATSDGSDTVLTFGPTASVRLAGVARSALTADNVVLAAGGGSPSVPPAGGTLSLGPATVSVAEGSGGGTTSFLFTVTRSGDLSAAASVGWSVTGSGVAAAGAADFVGDALPSGVARFAAGQATAAISVPVGADTAVEADEGFTVTLSAPSAGWTIAAGSAAGLIVNDDAAAGGGTPGQILTGSAARDELYGTAGNDTITGGAGNDYMEGGAGSDRFVINAGDGWDAIGDFQAGTGGDVLDLSGWTGLGNLDALLASATEDAGGTVLNLSNDTGVRLMGVTKASLTAANIRLADGPQQPAGPSITGLDWAPAAFDATAVTRVSVAADGAQANGASSGGAFSPDGRHVAFVSGASNLVAGDTNGRTDLFLKDLQTGTVTRIDLPLNSAGVSYAPGAPSFSADGTKLLYTSSEPSIPYTASKVNIHILDIATGTTRTIANGTDGAANLQLAADGQTLFYTNLPVAMHSTPTVEVHLRNLETEALTRISGGGIASAAAPSNARGPVMSSDGAFLAYSDYGALILRNLETGAETRLDQRPDGSLPAYSELGAAAVNAFSSDGRYVLFTDTVDGLAAGDTNGVQDVFVRDLQTGVTRLVSTAADGTAANGASRGVAFTPDGRSVLFTSAGSNLVAGDTNGAQDAFLKDLETGAVRRLSVAADGSELNAGVGQASLSADGTRILFDTAASNLVGGDTNGVADLFVAELDRLPAGGEAGLAGSATLSIGFAAGTGAGTGAVTQAIIDWGDGRTSTQSVAPGATSLSVGHLYATAGSFAGSVTLTDANGATASRDFRAQRVTGTTGAVLRGAGGSDLLIGGDGNDSLIGDTTGDAGDDFLFGGAGDDTLSGSYGDDVLIGGAGNDHLTGGFGSDVYVFGPASGMDRIHDFNPVPGASGPGADRIQIGIGQSWSVEASGNDALIRFSATDGVVLSGIRPDQVSASWFITG